MEESRADLHHLFHPRSVAIVGASDDMARIGGFPIRFLRQHGYGGKIFPVNLKYREIAGLACYLSLKEIPKKLVDKSNLISAMLNKKGSLFALDFIVSNNGNTYLLEGNAGPGLDWNMSLKRNELEAKKLIRLVVKQLTARSGPRLERAV